MTQNIDTYISRIVLPVSDSHKGQNGRLLLIGGSALFHAASLWSLTVASRIVDLVHFASVPENNDIVKKAKREFRHGIVVARDDIESYINEDDCILIGPGMTRDDETKNITNRLLKQYSQKQWVIDAGALQMMSLDLIPERAILTPHKGEFEGLWKKHQSVNASMRQNIDEKRVSLFAKEHNCIVLLKGEKDVISNGAETSVVEGGNAGMTKGGTGDVLAGLVAALACKSDPFASAVVGSYVNKKAGDSLYTSVGPFFNASDLADQIPVVLKELCL
jgi:hydroxyethylthiazole kinase-like uncharacterized protein yjeF